MKGLTLSTKEQSRLPVLNGVLERQWMVAEAAQLLVVNERHTWQVLAAYREEGAAALAHGNRGRSPSNATPRGIQAQVIALASDRYLGVNHTHFTELLAEREGIVLSRSTVRRLLTSAGLSTILRLTLLNNKPESGRVIAGYLGRREVGTWISRVDIADFMLRQLQDTKYLRQASAISN